MRCQCSKTEDFYPKGFLNSRIFIITGLEIYLAAMVVALYCLLDTACKDEKHTCLERNYNDNKISGRQVLINIACRDHTINSLLNI